PIVGTQAVDELEEGGEAEQLATPPDCYGRLFSLRDLKEDEKVVIGRNLNCSHVLSVSDDPHLLTYSQTHLEIKRVKANDGSFHTQLKDLSSNGTFVNGQKVGRNRSRVLANNDEISLAVNTNKAWTYIEFDAILQKQYPACVTEHYTVSKTLGSGAFGEVKLVFETGTCHRYAMKIISKKGMSLPTGLTTDMSIRREVSILQQLNHPNIVRIERFFDSNDRVFLILELAEGGELFDRITSQPNQSGFDNETAKFLCYQMAQAVKWQSRARPELGPPRSGRARRVDGGSSSGRRPRAEYLHDKDITHRDLKPENFLLLESGQNKTLVKLADFGVSKLVSSETMLRTFCGTQCYLAPEIMKSNGQPYTSKVDVWSLGVIFFICLAGYPPFTEERKDFDLQTQICDGHVNFPPEHWGNVDAAAIDLIKRMLVVQTDRRLSMRQVCAHHWFKDDKVLSELRQLLDRECQLQV
uniref:Serine/threonine-protein kinase Chk2 n=1 Tax=Macrostomum lignano TaxID=282301 RepID=A0A1I8I977_9PLAT